MKMTEADSVKAEKQKEYDEASVYARYGIKSLARSKADKRKVTKESVAFCCSKASLDERDINQCTQCVI